jgi:hypothetical protein
MDKIKLNNLLKDAGLKKKDLSQLFQMSQSAVNNWGSSKEIPYWLESWLNNYIKAIKYDSIQEMLCKNKT